LYALGYLEAEGRPAELEERIQMHSDRLYQQMLRHEEAVKQAKEQGLPPPEFKPVLSKDNLARVLGVKDAKVLGIAEKVEKFSQAGELSHVREELRDDYKDRTKNMTPDERMAEDASRLATNLLDVQKAEALMGMKKQQDMEADDRRATGQETMTDRIVRWFRPKD